MEELIDTSKLQLQSLKEFMNALGYEYSCHPTERFFYSNHPMNKARANVSFRTAVLLHNNKFMECHGKYFDPPWEFDEYTLTKAFASKIIHKIKLQYSRKSKTIVCQSNMVAFVKPRYEWIFFQGKNL